MKRAILLSLLSLQLMAAPAPEIEFESLRVIYPTPQALRDESILISSPLCIDLSVQGVDVSRKTRQEIYIEDLQLTDSRGNDLQPLFESDDACDNELTIYAKQYPQGIGINLSGTVYLYRWEKTTLLPPLQPDWEKGCTFTQNGMQIRCSADNPGHLYLNEQFIPTPSYRVEITAPQDNLSPVQEVTPLREDGTPFKDGEYVVDSDAKHGTYCFRLISATPPARIQLSVAADAEHYRIPLRMRLGLPGRLNLPAPGKR
ncbi:MAG: hypothetical protein IJ993_03245 [Akkermansia sp.]|nr:hypothetical protein [Akkermansia sp.]